MDRGYKDRDMIFFFGRSPTPNESFQINRKPLNLFESVLLKQLLQCWNCESLRLKHAYKIKIS